jgi:hypothetical protein
VKSIGGNGKKFVHPKVARIIPGIEELMDIKSDNANSDEEKLAFPRLPKQKPNLTIRKESFESEESTNESLVSEEVQALSPKSKMTRDLVSDYGA